MKEDIFARLHCLPISVHVMALKRTYCDVVDWVIVWLSGAQDDLEKVTKMAYDQIRSYGMDEVVGILSFPSAEESGFTKPYSRKLQAAIDEVL